MFTSVNPKQPDIACSNKTIIDLKEICESISTGIIDVVSKCILRNPCDLIQNSTDDSSTIYSRDNSTSLYRQDPLMHFFFYSYFGISIFCQSEFSCNKDDRTNYTKSNDDEERKDIDKFVMERFNCTIINQHVMNERPELILRLLLGCSIIYDHPW